MTKQLSASTPTELVIQNALKRLLENRLVMIIAHRLSTIRLSDEIMVIDHGQVVEREPHSELRKNGGIYCSFYKMQFKDEQGIDSKRFLERPS